MNSFKMNGVVWGIRRVEPSNPILIDRTGRQTLACTDPVTKRIYLSNQLTGTMYNRVLIHELCHCILISYGLLDEIHKMVKPEYWIEAEEFMCNLVADYSTSIQNIVNRLR